MDEPTLFTKIIRGEIPSSKVAEGENWYAFLDIYPRRTGHTLVVPKEECQRIADLSTESLRGLMEGVVEVQRRLSAEFGTQDFSIGVHDGPTAGQEVPHVHFHILPRTKNDSGLTLASMWPTTGIGEPDHASLGSLAEQIRMGA